ncbi:hypothetical protein GDO81_027816 [Engystomops pustulosus]|uniref:Secreted protein n=1 Tax=Engystomops pustulosus TaxID=76066 RepID=A0AAV6ZN86_ENGPU|nr:hypothetical protein GDO81_027816 [Engystomops pustulosus]
MHQLWPCLSALLPPLPLPTCSRRGLASVSEALCSPGLSTQLGSVTSSSSDPSVCSPLGLPVLTTTSPLSDNRVSSSSDTSLHTSSTTSTMSS